MNKRVRVVLGLLPKLAVVYLVLLVVVVIVAGWWKHGWLGGH